MATTSFQTYYSKQTGGQAKVLTGITLDGTENLLASLDGLRARGEASVPKILYRIAEQIMTEAKGQVPVDTGNLRASGHVLPPEWIGNWVLVTLGFGGPAGKGSGKFISGPYRGKKEAGGKYTATGKPAAPGKRGGYGAALKEIGYAMAVHEVNARHKVGNWKYLERPMLAWASKLEAKIGTDLRAELEWR